MTKQAQAQPEERPTSELLLRRFRLADQFVESVRKANIAAGLDEKYMNRFIGWRELAEEIRYKNWLEKVTNKRTEKFWQIADLKARDLIPDEEYENEGKTYPYRVLDSLHKIRTPDGKLWLQRHETWYAIDGTGSEVHISVNDLDFYKTPRVMYERVPKSPSDPEGPTIRIGTIRQFYNNQNDGPKIYLTEYSKEKVDQFLRYAKPLDNHGNGTILILINAGAPKPVAVTYEEFTAPNFEDVFRHATAPEPTFKDFIKDYRKAAKKAEEEADLYQ